jgi:DNA primase
MGLYHCFTCGAAGDVVMLLAKLEGLSNVEAGRRLVAEYGVRGAASNGGDAVWTELKRWNPKTVEVLPTVELPPSEPLDEYRGFSKQTIEHFCLRKVSTGILIPFREEMAGRVVGYSIRQINRQPKYINSTGFRKSDYLYGMFELIEYGDVQKHLIICEGQFDCIRISDSGHTNVVATLGATLTPAQAYILGHWASKLTILYDGDEAGRVGAQKIKETYSSMFSIVIKSLPEGEDPDTGDLGILDDGE